MAEPRAILDPDPANEADGIGYLYYEAPDGRADCIPVTRGPSFERNPERETYKKNPVWHIETTDTHIIVSPSIDIKDRYHTGNPVTFRRHQGTFD